jgi:2-iminobutanoate/2-iminopropanoate deaminase
VSLERILHQGAPTPRGPYSSAVRAGDFIFVSGLGPVADNDQYVFGDIRQQTRQTLLNLTKILASCGAHLPNFSAP